MKQSHRHLAQRDAGEEQRETMFWLLFESSVCWHTGHAEYITRHADTQVTYFINSKGSNVVMLEDYFSGSSS